MKIQPLIEKLEGTEVYKKFKEDYKDSFLVAGFFVLDYETNKNVNQIDYFIPSEKKVAAFTMKEEIGMQILETINDKIPETLPVQTNVDLDAIKGILEDGMKNRNITEDLKKVIAVIQTLEGKKIWILNCIMSGMEILKAHIDDESKTILKMEKASVLDYIKKVPMKGATQNKPSKENIEKQIDQLDTLKEQLEKAKEKIKE